MRQRATVKTPCYPFLMPVLVGVLLFFGTREALAQQASVRGFVTDSATEEALQGATVALSDAGGTLRGAATDGDGYFIVNRVTPGRYTLRITFIGYLRCRAGAFLARHDQYLCTDLEG